MVENATWEKFTSVQQGDYTFVEEGLSLLAPLIGVDSNNILMDYDDLCSASEKNQNAFYLYFKNFFRSKGTKKHRNLQIII